MAKREVIIELSVAGPAFDQFAKFTQQQNTAREATKALKKELRELDKDSENYASEVERINKALAKQDIIASNAGIQMRELRNKLNGATDAGLRFRDKMADATLEAIKQSGILGQLQAKSDTLNVKIVNLTKSYKEGDISITTYNQQLNILQQELNQTTVQMTAMDKKVDQLTLDFKEGRITAEQFKSAVASINSEIKAQGTAFSKGISDLKSYALGFVGIVAAAQAVIGVFSNAARTVADFDKALSSIRALGGEYATNIDAIGEAAMTTGMAFGFTATETAGAVEALAKAGIAVDDILGGSLEGALTLAAAGQLDVATAAETAAKAMTQFGLAGSDIPMLADLLANGASIATGDVTDFAAALSQAGLVAAQTGLGIDEAVTGLTAFAQAGLLGSDAGTSFRSMLQRLAKPTGDAKQAMDDLGISAFDAQGNFVGLEAFAGQLQTGLKDLTTEQRANAIVTIFGADAQRAANVLYEQGATGIAALSEQVTKSGTAANMASVQQDNLRGKLDKAKAAWDAFVLNLFDGGNVVNDVLNLLVEKVNAAYDWFVKLYDGSILVRGAIGEAFIVISTAWEALVFAFKSGFEIIATPIKAIIQLLTGDFRGAFNTVTDGVVALFENAKDFALNVAGNIKDTVDEVDNPQAFNVAAEQTDKLTTATKDNTEATRKQIEVNTDLGTEIPKVIELTDKKTNSLKEQSKVVRVLTDDMREFLQAQKNIEEGQGVGRMQTRGGEAKPLDPLAGRLLGPSPAQVQAAKDLTDTDTETFVTAQEAKIAAIDALGNAIGGIAQLMGDQTKAGKMFATAQALINTYLGVTQILANKSALPEPAATIQKTASIAATVATGLAAVRRIQGFEEGGYTSKKASNHTEVGVVHANEWVAPAWMTKSSAYAPIIHQLEEARKMRGMSFGPDGFYSGGSAAVRGTALVNSAREPGSVSGSVIMGADLARAIRGLNISPIVRVTDIMDVMGSVARVSQASAI